MSKNQDVKCINIRIGYEKAKRGVRNKWYVAVEHNVGFTHNMVTDFKCDFLRYNDCIEWSKEYIDEFKQVVWLNDNEY